MENYHYWLIAGFVLVITELVTGTFFLLVIGLAAFAAAAAAYLGAGFWVQAIIASVVAVAGVALVSKRKLGAPETSGASGGSLDFGHPVMFESWTSEADGLARVNYRGSTWDAVVAGAHASGDREGSAVYFIYGMEGNTLRVSLTKPANKQLSNKQ